MTTKIVKMKKFCFSFIITQTFPKTILFSFQKPIFVIILTQKQSFFYQFVEKTQLNADSYQGIYHTLCLVNLVLKSFYKSIFLQKT